MNGERGENGHVAFVTNQLGTHFLAANARRLRNKGARVSWIATSTRWAEVARVEADAGEDDILDLSLAGPDWSEGRRPAHAEFELLARIEQAGALTIKNMITMDRELNKRPWRYGLAYAAAVARHVDAFFEGRGIDLCVGETTWCGELLIAQLARLHGATYAGGTSVRVPSGRFGLEDAATQRLFLWTTPIADHFRQAREIIAEFKKGGVKPYYMESIPDSFTWQPHWTKEAFIALINSNSNRFDYSIPPLHVRGARRLRSAWNAIAAKRISFQTGPSRPEIPYVLVTLHVQPESAVDVLGAPFNNQIENIRALSRGLPVDYEILVKEHPAAIGGRSLAFYNELSRIPGVQLIDPFCDTMTLVRGARLVASPSGSACYEAALLGIPAVCFGRTFFGPALLREGFDPYATDRAAMARILEEAAAARRSELKALAAGFLAHALANSYEGRYGGWTDAHTMSAENLDRCASGLFEALARVRARAAIRS
jgi:capsular polysaccharide biosynthesis protein